MCPSAVSVPLSLSRSPGGRRSAVRSQTHLHVAPLTDRLMFVCLCSCTVFVFAWLERTVIVGDHLHVDVTTQRFCIGGNASGSAMFAFCSL